MSELDDNHVTADPTGAELYAFAQRLKAACRSGEAETWPLETRVALGLTDGAIAYWQHHGDEGDPLDTGDPPLWFRTDAPAPPGWVPVELWNELHPNDRRDGGGPPVGD